MRVGCVGSSEVDFDVGGAEFGEALAADERVGIDGGDDAARDAGGDEGVGAGAGAAVVGAGFEGDVGGCAVDVVAESGGLLEGGDLGVVAGVVEVCAFAEECVVEREDAAYGGVGAGEGCGFAREVEGAGEVEFVLRVRDMQDQDSWSGVERWLPHAQSRDEGHPEFGGALVEEGVDEGGGVEGDDVFELFADAGVADGKA